MIKHLRLLSSLAFASGIFAACLFSSVVHASERKGTCRIADGYEFQCITESTAAQLKGREGILTKIWTFDYKREWRVFASFGEFFYLDDSFSWVQVNYNCSGREAMNYLYDRNGGLLLGYPQLCGE